MENEVGLLLVLGSLNQRLTWAGVNEEILIACA